MKKTKNLLLMGLAIIYAMTSCERNGDEFAVQNKKQAASGLSVVQLEEVKTIFEDAYLTESKGNKFVFEELNKNVSLSNKEGHYHQSLEPGKLTPQWDKAKYYQTDYVSRVVVPIIAQRTFSANRRINKYSEETYNVPITQRIVITRSLVEEDAEPLVMIESIIPDRDSEIKLASEIPANLEESQFSGLSLLNTLNYGMIGVESFEKGRSIRFIPGVSLNESNYSDFFKWFSGQINQLVVQDTEEAQSRTTESKMVAKSATAPCIICGDANCHNMAHRCTLCGSSSCANYNCRYPTTCPKCGKKGCLGACSGPPVASTQCPNCTDPYCTGCTGIPLYFTYTTWPDSLYKRLWTFNNRKYLDRYPNMEYNKIAGGYCSKPYENYINFDFNSQDFHDYDIMIFGHYTDARKIYDPEDLFLPYLLNQAGRIRNINTFLLCFTNGVHDIFFEIRDYSQYMNFVSRFINNIDALEMYYEKYKIYPNTPNSSIADESLLIHFRDMLGELNSGIVLAHVNHNPNELHYYHYYLPCSDGSFTKKTFSANWSMYYSQPWNPTAYPFYEDLQ